MKAKVKGFTIIEITVVTAIIGILTVVMFANYRQGELVIAEQQSLQTVAQAVRAAQNRALGAETIACNTSPPPPCRYGVDINKVAHPTTVIVFADGTVGAGSNNGDLNPGEELETFELEKGFEIIGVSPGPNQARILFEPPDPVITFDPPPPGTRIISITGGRSVTVWEGGSVDIN